MRGDCVFTHSGCCSQGPQTGWLHTMEVRSVMVLEAGSLQARSWEGHVPPEVSRGESFLSYSYLLRLFKVTYLFILATPARGLSCSAACVVTSPALQGGFLTAGPPGEPLLLPPFWQLLGILVFLGLQPQHYGLCSYMAFSPRVSAFTQPLSGHWALGLGPTLILILINFICRVPISK